MADGHYRGRWQRLGMERAKEGVRSPCWEVILEVNATAFLLGVLYGVSRC